MPTTILTLFNTACILTFIGYMLWPWEEEKPNKKRTAKK